MDGSETEFAGDGKRVLTIEQIERWHALRMMIGFCREEAKVLGADFLVYCLELGIVAADDHMRAKESRTVVTV
ncbi:MAG: hypothetical protein OEL76_03740 [Siculibacillus sp.]|nr:hypothetical protein [Siculibacillus sp.]